jgi:hypothetical protein
MPGKMMKKPMYGHGKKTKMKGKNYSMGRAIEMGKRPGMMGGKMVEMEQDKVKRLYGGGKTK